ncbi:MAG TPA: hypothetical protein VFJ57_02845 [Solirubrobacterales bacterium]|nr:hypothetical protein [Solirubrobacterales bacterium]
MKARKTGGRIAGPSGPSPICAPLSHPLRVQILAVANERDISPKGFVDEALQQTGMRFTSRANALSHVSYRFRELEKAGCIEVVDTRQRRGAVEHIYRGTCRVEFTTGEFDKLPATERRRHSRTGCNLSLPVSRQL